MAALANHLTTGGAVTRVTWAGTGVWAAWGAGLGAALLTYLTLHRESETNLIGLVQVYVIIHMIKPIDH